MAHMSMKLIKSAESDYETDGFSLSIQSITKGGGGGVFT